MIGEPDSQLIITDPDAKREVVAIDMRQCVHCHGHFPVQPGSGKTRGFCTCCNGPLCGAKNCLERCKNWEKVLDELEGARTPTQKSVSLYIP